MFLLFRILIARGILLKFGEVFSNCMLKYRCRNVFSCV